MKVEYCSYTDYRNKYYQIYTKLITTENSKIVIKEAVYPEGIGHIANMLKVYQALSSKPRIEGVSYCPVQLIDNTAQFEYIEGQSLKSRFNEAINNNSIEHINRMIFYYINLLDSILKPTDTFRMTNEFNNWFGEDGAVLTGDKAVENINIDLNVGNIIRRNDSEVIIDYEWFFPFLIPIEFVKYVNLSWLYYFDVPQLHNYMSFEELLNKANIAIEKVPVYKKMEFNHSKNISYDGDTDMASLKDRFLRREFVEYGTIQIEYHFTLNDGSTLIEKINQRYNLVSKNNRHHVDIPDKAVSCKVYLLNTRGCILKWLFFYADNEQIEYRLANGFFEEPYVFFDSDVPLIIIDNLENKNELEMTAHYHLLNDSDIISVFNRFALNKIRVNEYASEIERLKIKRDEN